MRRGTAKIALVTAMATAFAGACSKATLPGTGGGACSTDLSGTWDVIATRPGGGTTSWVMTIGASTFSMSSGSGSVAYSDGATKQLTWTTPRSVTPVNVTNSPVPLNAGSLPLALGGDWSLSANQETCSLTVAATGATGSCDGPGYYVGSGNWPYPLPSPIHGRIYSANRVSTLASQLGELGGQWQLANGGSGTCTATVEGNRVTATCINAQPLTGTLELTLGSDCVASGSSGGYELSAARR
jgi:hypothetical protein